MGASLCFFYGVVGNGLFSVRYFLLNQDGFSIDNKRKRAWRVALICSLWVIVKEKNMKDFGKEKRMLVQPFNFLCGICSCSG